MPKFIIINGPCGVGKSTVASALHETMPLSVKIEVAKKYQAEVIELILWAPKEIVMARANDRGWREGGSLTPEKCEIFWQKIDEMKDRRPSAIVIDTSKISAEETLAVVKGLVKV